jgi:hypothetical protein
MLEGAPAGYDCSGLVMMAYLAAGISLPRTTFQQVAAGTPVYSGSPCRGSIKMSFYQKRLVRDLSFRTYHRETIVSHQDARRRHRWRAPLCNRCTIQGR